MTEQTLPHDINDHSNESTDHEDNDTPIPNRRYSDIGKRFSKAVHRFETQYQRPYRQHRFQRQRRNDMDVFVAERHADDPTKYTIELPTLGPSYRILFDNVLYRLVRA